MENPYQPPKSQFDLDPIERRSDAVDQHLGLRWGRMKYLIAFIATWFFLATLTFLLGAEGLWKFLMMSAMYVAITYISRFRLRDFGANPNYCWLMLIPVINLLMAIFLMCKPGHEGANRYGYPGA